MNAMASGEIDLRTGRDVVNLLTNSFFNIGAGSSTSLRFGGPNMHSVSYAYVMAIGGLVALSLGAGWFVLPILPLLFLIGVKGSSILLLGTIVLWVIGRLFGTRFLAVAGLALGTAYLAGAIKFGIAAGDYHVLGLIGGVNGFLHNPIGHGLGVGGNLSSTVTSTDLTKVWDANQHYGAEVPLESAIGVLLVGFRPVPQPPRLHSARNRRADLQQRAAGRGLLSLLDGPPRHFRRGACS